ncbi:EF-P 5-aminopentanol modification-associated protein YfmF [uncultured Limosilactobacillus sp.]|uniref:EF-P 5-aminopentanol modification-associated protein YfmF n=1 Tax=uncultured Limosilactobacillus sp. TaxID=2837629 RepID=UPI0025D3999E|nr:pitrilysin family protein [uncultured Limosilactobacillus sp.]
MDKQIMAGVHLHVIPTHQFQTTKIMMTFTSRQTATNAAVRNLLTNILSTSLAKYPTQTALARQLSNLYGAMIGAYVSRLSYAHVMRFKISVINERYTDQPLLPQGFDLLKELIFNPLMNADSFDALTFKLQQENLINTLKSWDDDKQFYALRQVEELVFQNDPVLATPSTGTVDQVAELTNLDLMRAYQDMIAKDRIDIYVVGDVDAAEVEQLVSQLPLKERQFNQFAVLTRPNWQGDVLEKVEHQPIEQAKLDRVYLCPVNYREPLYRAAMVMNGLLGGTPYSFLFTNVREQASMAYYASSSLRPFNGHLVMQTGIQPDNVTAVQTLLDRQVTLLQAGDFSLERLQMVKDALINQYETSQDYQNSLLERQLTATLTGIATANDFAKEIQAVTKDQVVEVAQGLSKCVEYVLTGED